MDDSQWDGLHLLTNVAVSVWETERKINNLLVLDNLQERKFVINLFEEPKVQKLDDKLCNSNGQKERFFIGKGKFTLSTESAIEKKRTTVGKKRTCPWSFQFPSSSSPSSLSESETNRIAKKKRKISRVFETPEPSEMPAVLKNRIVDIGGGGELTFVLQKELSPTDVSRNNNRLSVPERLRTRAEFMEEEEKAKVMRREGMEVLMVDQELREYNLCFKAWKMGKSAVYNLVSKWNSVVEKNGLVEDDVVQLWSFRRQNKLCFALVKIT